MSEQVKIANIIPIKGKKSKLYLGSKWSAGDTDFLNKHNIKHILNIGSKGGAKIDELKDINLLKLDVDDDKNEKISKYFDISHDFINKALKSPFNCLVHCEYGISRSPAIVMSYLVKDKHYPLEKAYNIVEEARPTIGPNENFINQLKKYEKKIK